MYKKYLTPAILLSVIFILSDLRVYPQWISQGLGWTTPSRGLRNISIVNQDVVWVSSFDGTGSPDGCHDISVTINGGLTWTPRIINAINSLSISMVHGVSPTTAWVAMYATGMVSAQGIYKTTNGGINWAREGPYSMFGSQTSFPNVVYFWDSLHGCAIGDPVNNKFEIYTSENGGDDWNQVAPSSLPTTVFAEFGFAGGYAVSGKNIWFGTIKGKMYHSADRGHSWTNSSLPGMSGEYTFQAFSDSLNGLCMKILANTDTTNLLDITVDGGSNWTSASYTGQVFNYHITNVPWTTGVYVSTGAQLLYPARQGVTYTLDNGSNWIVDAILHGKQVTTSAWLSDAIGWAGVFNTGPSDGIYKFNGVLGAPLALTSPFGGEKWNACSQHSITWASNGISNIRIEYSVNGGADYTTIVPSVPASSGSYSWNIPNSPSPDCRVRICDASNPQVNDSSRFLFTIIPAVGYSKNHQRDVRIYPNPSQGRIKIESGIPPGKISVYDLSGIQVFSTESQSCITTLDLSFLAPGLYFISLFTADRSLTRKIMMTRER